MHGASSADELETLGEQMKKVFDDEREAEPTRALPDPASEAAPSR